jgi:hypothetical protein
MYIGPHNRGVQTYAAGLPALGGAAFAPTDIAGLQFWVAARLEAFANNDPVPTWTDQSGSGRNATSATNQPTFKTSQVNGLAAIEGDGTNDIIQTALFTLNQPYTVFIVVKQITWTNTERIFDGSTVFIRQNSATPNIQLTGSGAGIQSTALSVGAWGLVAGVVNGASSTLAINGGADITGDVGVATALSRITLFNRADGSGPSNVSIAECLVYNSALSSGNQASVKTYLNGLYALY